VAGLPSVQRRLAGGKVHPRAPVELRGDAEQVGRGWRLPERWDDGEAEERCRGGSVRQRGGSPVVAGGGEEVLQLRRGEG
jgi:hypothetical protein